MINNTNRPLFLGFQKYGISLNKIDVKSTILSIGTFLHYDNKKIVSELKKSEVINFYPIEDDFLYKIAIINTKYEVGSEVGVLALLAKELLKDKEIPNNIKTYIDNLDEGHLSAESNVGEEEIEQIVDKLKANSTILLGKDLYEHPQADLLCGIIAIISRCTNIKISVIDNINIKNIKNTQLPLPVDEIDSFDGVVIYYAPSEQKSDFLYGSTQFSVAAKIKDKMNITIKNEQCICKKKFSIDSDMKGIIAVAPTIEAEIHGYRYKKSKVILDEQD